MLGAIAKFVGSKLLGRVLRGSPRSRFGTFGQTFGRKDDGKDEGMEREHRLAEEVGSLITRAKRRADRDRASEDDDYAEIA